MVMGAASTMACLTETLGLMVSGGATAPHSSGQRLRYCVQTGRQAVVFNSPEDAAARIDDPALGIRPDHVLILRNAGPVGAGMPEAGSLPIPKYLAAQGVTDMVRVSDARMSGTAYGTVILHVSPEAAVGGPLALVRTGDLIELDVPNRTLDLLVDQQELQHRREAFIPPTHPTRGWKHLYANHVLQAHLGADLDFL